MPFSDEQNQSLETIQDQEKQVDPIAGPGPGDPKKSPVTAKVVPIGTAPRTPETSTQVLDPDTITRLTKSISEGTSGPRQDIPRDLSFQPKAGQDNYLLRAQDQGFLAQLGKTAGNLLPNIASDLLDMTGQAANLPATLAGQSDYDSGGLGRLATAIRDPFGEVYREHPDKTFDLADPAWWLQHTAGFVEGAASFVLPGEGEAMAFSKLGQLVADSGLGATALKATQLLGHGISAFSMGYLMSAASGKKVYDEAYKTNYDRFIRQGYDPSHAHEEATQMAAQGAARTVQIGTLLNGILNLTALAPMFKGSPQEGITNLFRTGEGAIQQGEALAGWKSRLEGMSVEEATEPFRHGLTSHGFQAFQVGLQGLNTEYAEKTGAAQGTGQLPQQLDMLSDYFSKITDQEGALNMLSGLLGGLTQNILMDRVPLHRIIKIDPATNKPLYKDDPTVLKEGDKPRYQTELVSARTRDMLNNRQYFSSVRDAVLQDIRAMQDLQAKYNDANNKGKPMERQMAEDQLLSVGALNAVAMGMTENWKEVYKQLGEQYAQLKPGTQRATAQLDALQGIYDRVAKRFIAYQGDPEMGQLQDHMFHQEANHYLFGDAIQHEEKDIVAAEPPIEGHDQAQYARIHIHQRLATELDKDITALEGSDEVKKAQVARQYGINAYDKVGLKRKTNDLANRLRREFQDAKAAVQDAKDVLDRMEDKQPPAIDRDIMERRVALEKARTQHEQQDMALRELRTSEGRQEFLDALRKKNAAWKNHLDEQAAKEVQDLFHKQQDKEMAARLDKEQKVQAYNDTLSRHRGNVDKMNALATSIGSGEQSLKDMEGKKPFFRNIAVQAKKLRTRLELAKNKAEWTRLHNENLRHEETMQQLQGNVQDAAIKEDTARNAHREDVENDSHTQQDVIAPAKTDDAPDNGMPASIPQEGWPAETAYAGLRDTLSPSLLNVLDNLEMVMPQEFSRDLARNAFNKFVDEQQLSKDRVIDIVEKMKDWWEEHYTRENAIARGTAPDWAPILEPQPTGNQQLDAVEQQRFRALASVNAVKFNDPIERQEEFAKINAEYDAQRNAVLAQNNMVSDIPEADSPIISYSAAMNIDNLGTNPSFTEVGAKALTAMKVNSRSIQYMRVEKGDKILFLPLYDKLDPTFNRNILKPGFISDGDALRFEVDTNWNGQVTLDKADAPDEYGMPTTRGDSFADYSTPDGKIIMTKQATDLEPAYGNAPIKIVHEKSGETVGYLPRVDWVMAKRTDSNNYRNIEDNLTLEDGTIASGNVEAQKERLLAIRAEVALAHNRGEGPVKTHVSSTAPGHLFLSTDVNMNTERSKLAPKLAKNLLPDKNLKLAILDRGTMMVGHGTPHTGPANFTAESLAKKYQTEGQQWRNTPMVLLPMPNGKVTESPLFTRQLKDRPADIHTIAKVMESYLAQGTAAETPEHSGIINKLQQHTGYDISTAAGLRSFINQYYTYTQSFNEVHTRTNAETSGPKVPRFMVDIPNLQPGEQKAAIKVGTSFSGVPPVYALTRDGKINPEFDQALRDGLQTHYKNVVYTSQDIKGINDKRPIAAPTIQRDGKIRVDRYDSYNDYAKTFTTTVVYGLHQATDGTYLYGANPITEFDFNSAMAHTSLRDATGLPEGGGDADEFIRAMMNSAVKEDQLPAEKGPVEAKVYTRDQLVTTDKGKPLTEAGILANINKLYDEAATNPEQTYQLDIPGAGKTKFRTEEGWMTHSKLAQLLNNREIPYNIKLGDDIRSVLENTPRRFLNSMMFQDDSMYTPLRINDKVLGQQLDNTFVPVRDKEGNHTGGYFSPERQGAVVDSIVKAIALQMAKKGANVVRVGDMMNTVKTNVFENLKKVYDRLAGGEVVKGFDIPVDKAKQLSQEYQAVLNSFEPKADTLSFWGEAMKKLDQLGIRVKDNNNRPQREDEVPAITNGNEGTMEGSDGKGRDWFDDHFEQNPMDSASSRVKLFVATTTESTLGTEPQPPRVKLAIDNEGVRQRIAQGKYLFTAVTVEEAKKLGLNGVGTEGFNTIDGKPFRITNVGVIQEGDVHAPKIAYEENKEVSKGDIKLQFTPWKPKPEQLIPNRNYLGLPQLADYEQLYEDTMAVLGDTPRNLDAYINRLKEEGRNGKPNLYALASNLEKAPTQVQNEFVSVMTLHYQPFTMVMVDPKTDAQGNPYYTLRTINANRASQLNTIIDHWQQSQKTATILEKTSSGTTVVARTLAEQLKTELHEVNKLFERGDGNAPTKARDLLDRTLAHNGIVLPEKAMAAFIANTKRWTQKTSLAGDFRRQFAVTDKGEAQGIVSAFILRLAGENKAEDVLDSMDDRSYKLNNPLYMEGTAMKILAKVAAAYTPNLYSNTHRSSEGKSIYDWGLPHKLSNDFNKLKTNEQWRQQFQASDFAKRAWLLEHINNNPELRDRAGLSYLDGIATKGRKDSGTTRPDMSDREQLFTALGLFQNGGDSRYSHYLSLTHSDRSTTPVYMNMPRIPVVTTMRMVYDKVNDTQRAKFGIHDEVIKRMYDVFLSEYDRINKAAQVIEKEGGYNDARYEKGSQYFYALPQFNHDRMAELVKEGKITEADFNSIWMMGDKKLNVLEGRGFKEAVNKVLQLHVEEMMTNAVREWKDKGVISDDNIPFDPKYTNKLLAHVGIYSNKDGTHRTRENQAVSKEYVNRLSAQLAARDYAVNSFLFNTSLSQIFFGDPAQNFKGSVEKTMVEYGKRLTQFISPRKEGNWRVPDYTAVTVKDFTTKADYLGELSEAYRDINATDAQEVTTVMEKLNVARAYGRISDAMYNEMAQIVKDAKAGYYAFVKPEHREFIMQPEKPLYSGSRPPFQGAILNDYVKSSAYALYPPLLAGKELDKLRVAMENGGVDRVNFESAKKVGIPAVGLQLFDNQGRIDEDVFKTAAWMGESKGSPVPSARQMLSRDNFGLSQEVPYDETKEEIRTVSQMNKLITEAIPTIATPFQYKGTQVSGAELAQRKEEIRKQLVKSNRDKLLAETGATIDDEGNIAIKDQQKVYDALLKHAQEQGGYSPNDLAILQHTLPNSDELIVPLMYSPSASKFESLVMSMVNGITDIYMPGKSYVQASPAGHRLVRNLEELSPEEHKAIVRVGDWDGGELKTLRAGGDGESLPAQIILPFHFQVNGRPARLQDYTTTDEQGNTMLDLERVPRELLQQVAARIPNSGHNLMLPTEIVGFVPAEMGDLAIVPDAITKQMGSDFDVDKLYTYRRGYVNKQYQPTKDKAPQYDNIDTEENFQTAKLGDREGQPETKEAAAEVDKAVVAGDVPMGKGGETFHELEDRIIPDFRKLLDTAKDGTIVITHSSVLKLMKQWNADGRPDDNRVNPQAYNDQSTENGDVASFKGKNGTVWVVRHGQTDDNLAGNFRSPDTNLTDQGVEQALAAGRELKKKLGGIIPEQVIASHLPRTIHTANLIMDVLTGKTADRFEVAPNEGDTGLKNDYFDTHWSVLMHKEMRDKVLAPLDKEDLKEEAAQIEQWENKGKRQLSFYDPTYQLRDFQNQKDAKRLVGASSLSVTFNAVAQDKGLTIGVMGYEESIGSVPREIPIEIIDEDGKHRKLSHLSGYGRSEYRKDGKKTGEVRTKNDNHVMQQAEFLDYSKNRVSDKVHLGVQTYPASAAFTQLQEPDGKEPGWTPSIKYNTRLLSQPIIQEYAQRMSAAQDTFSEGFDPDRKNSIIAELSQQYITEGKLKPEELNQLMDPVRYADLTEALQKREAQKDYYLKQIKALQLFKQLDQVGAQLRVAQSTINHDVNGAGPNLLTTMGKDVTRTNLEMAKQPADRQELKILHANNLYTRPDGQTTEQGAMYDTIHKAAYGIAGNFFPYKEMKPLFNYVMEHTNRQDLSVDMQKNIFNAMKSYLYSHPRLGLWEDPIGTRAKLLYGEQSLAWRVLDAKNSWGEADMFLQRLQPDIDPDGLRPDYVKYQGAKITKLDQDENTRHWVDLLTSDDPVKSQLGHDLVRYAYLTGGLQDAQSYIKFLPYSYLIGTDFGHKLRELTKDIEKLVMADNFRTQVFQHNPQMAKGISADFSETGSKFEQYPERFILPPIDLENSNSPAKSLIVRAMDTDGKRRPMYPEFLSHYSKAEAQWVLYKKAGLVSDSDSGTGYIRVDTLGNGSMDEYSFADKGLAQRSLDPRNRSKAYDNIEPAYRMLNSAVTHRHGEEVMEDMGLHKEGGEQELAGMLAKLAVDPTVPEHNRVLSSWLATLHGQGRPMLGALGAIRKEAIANLPKLEYKIVPQEKIIEITGSPWSAAVMDSLGNQLWLNEEHMEDKAELAMYTNHELIHYHTAVLTKLYDRKNTKTAAPLWEAIATWHPEIKKAMDDLEAVRKQAVAAVKEEVLKRGRSFEQEIIKVRSGHIEDNWHKWMYATDNNTEFIAHALSDINFMRWLNGKDFKGEPKGFLGKIVDIVKRMMSGIAQALGTDARKNSLLEQAVQQSMNLMVHARAESVPDREQLSTSNNMGPDMDWISQAIDNPTLTAMDRLAGKLAEQRDELTNSLTGRLSKEEYSAKRTQLDQIETDIESLRKHQSFQIAAEIGSRHLDWVADILKEDKPTPSQIMTGNRILEVWGNLIPLVYGEGEGVEEPDPAFAQLAAKAQDMDFKMLRKAEKALVDLSDGTLAMRDYAPSQLQDISKDQALLRDVVSAAGSKVTQYIGTHLQQTARHAMDDITRLVKETRAVEDGLKDTVGDLSKFYDKFFQQNSTGDAWGLVQRFSQNWYDFRRNARNRRQTELKRIELGAGDAAQKAQMKSQVWTHYWKDIDANAVFADTRKLFDPETGELKDDPAAKAHRAELEKHTDKETTDELIKTAQERYKQYLDHKQPYFDQLEAEEAAGTKTAAEVKNAKDDFVNKWSPNTFFQNRGGKFGTYGGSDYYAKMAPKKAVKGFYDDKFQAIHQDPTARKFYTWLTGKLEELKAALPVKVNDEYLGANFFPVVKKSLVTDMLNIPEYIRTMGERTMRDLGATPWEEAMNASTFRQLPIDYIDRDPDRNPLSSRSKDIPRVLEIFGMVALHYKHFSDARDGIDMGEAILQKLDQSRAAGTTQMEVKGKLVSVNDGLKNTLDAVRYMKDYLMYRKARQLEGRSDMKLYSLNPVEQIKTSHRVKDLLAQREKLQDQILNGEIDPEEGNKQLEPIDKELRQYEGLRIYGSKLGDKLITINQLKTLSYNPFSGLANMTFGVVSAGIHANGGRDYSWRDLSASLKMMMHSTAKWVTLGSKESVVAEKILAVMDRTGVIGDVIDSRYGKVDIRDRKAPWRHAINPYNWMRSGDYFMKGLTTMAMMLHDKVEVTEKGEKKTISLWEAMDNEGKWNSERFGENKEWYSEDVQEQKAWDKFRNKAVRVNMIIHGNQDKTSPKLANKYILGRLVGQFRMSWLPEGWYSRFQQEHFDIQLGREVKGRYRTIAQLGFGGYALTTLRQLYSMIGKIDPYTGMTRLDGKALTETDRENMRRNFAELAFVTGILGMVVGTRALASDSDDEKTAARYRLLMNMLIRNKQDLEFYASPQVFDTVTRDIIPAANVLKDYGKALTATGKLLFNDDFQFQQWLLAMTHAGIPIPQATLINKTNYMLSKDLDNSPY